MRETGKVAKEAIQMLAFRATARTHAANPDAYHATVLRDLRARLWEPALDALAENPNHTAASLADLLEPPKPKPKPAKSVYDGWTGATEHEPGVDVEHAKRRIESIREALQEQLKEQLERER